MLSCQVAGHISKVALYRQVRRFWGYVVCPGYVDCIFERHYNGLVGLSPGWSVILKEIWRVRRGR